MRAFFIIGLILFWITGSSEFASSADVRVSSLGASDKAEIAAQPSNVTNSGNSESGNGRISDTALQTVVPSYLIGLWGHAILVEKSTQKLYLYDKDYKLVKTFHVTTGQNQGDKRMEGDKKTPEGIYFFTHVKEQKELLPKYGVMALPINYPNFIDTRLRKKGNGIWLHATDDPTRPIKPFDSKGCVVAANEDVLELADHIKLQTTPMVIVDKLEYAPAENIADTRREVEGLIEKWRSGWQKKDIAGYMDAYSKDFRGNGMDFQKWKKYKESLNRQYGTIGVSLSDIKILRHHNHIVVAFTQHYKNNQLDSVGIKRLYLVKEKSGWKIMGEEWSPVPAQIPAMIAKRYAGYRAAKIETLPKQVVSQTPAPLQKISFEANSNSSAQPPSNGIKKESVSSKLSVVDIEDFTIDREKTANRVRFKLINKTMEQQKISGRLTIVTANKNGNGLNYTSYPPMTLEQGAPKDFRNGEWFSIRRFKIVSGAIEEKTIDHVAVLVYSKTGELLLYKEFPTQIKQ